MNQIAPALAVALAATACVPKTTPPPVNPTPAPVPAPSAAGPVPAPKPGADWRDLPLTPGTWVYRQDARGSIALYGQPNQDAVFTMRCDKQRGQIYLSRQGAAPGALAMTIRTSFDVRTLTAQPTGGTPAYMAAALSPSDKLLDSMGFSRGRFTVDMPPMATLVIPSYAEVLRVTEDCR